MAELFTGHLNLETNIDGNKLDNVIIREDYISYFFLGTMDFIAEFSVSFPIIYKIIYYLSIFIYIYIL